MNRNSVYLILLFSIIWIILSESYAPATVVAGLVFSVACVYFSHRLLAMDKIANVKFLRLFLYVFYLLGQIYLAGFAAIKLIIKGASADIVRIKTNIDNDFLRVILANSITLTPGTLTLGLNDDRLTVLWLRDKKSAGQGLENADDQIKGKLEKQLSKAIRRTTAARGQEIGDRDQKTRE